MRYIAIVTVLVIAIFAPAECLELEQVQNGVDDFLSPENLRLARGLVLSRQLNGSIPGNNTDPTFPGPNNPDPTFPGFNDTDNYNYNATKYNGTFPLFPIASILMGLKNKKCCLVNLAWNTVLTALLATFWGHYKKYKKYDYDYESEYGNTGYGSDTGSSGYGSSGSSSSGYGSSGSGSSSGHGSHGTDTSGGSPYDTGATGGDDGGSSYASFRALSSGFNWEAANILEMISAGEDLYSNFDVSNLDCHKRLICEVSKESSSLGYFGEIVATLVKYLDYIKYFGMPEEINTLVDEYSDAADRARSLSKTCGEMYETCRFSFKDFVDTHWNRVKK